MTFIEVCASSGEEKKFQGRLYLTLLGSHARPSDNHLGCAQIDGHFEGTGQSQTQLCGVEQSYIFSHQDQKK